MINNRLNRMRQAFYNGGDDMGGASSPQKPNMPTNVKSMQKRLQKISFALVEVVLYLDAYPNCERAKKYELLLVPSNDFGCGGFVRISYCVTTEQIKRSLPAFKALAEEYGLGKK